VKIAIIDYGMGNIFSIQNAIKYIGYDSVYTDDFGIIRSADKIILPGVGSFRKAMENILNKEIDKLLQEVVCERKTSLLGICLGMQLLAKSSTEDRFTEGLGFIDAKIDLINKYDNLKIPHVGFDEVNFCKDSLLFNGIENASDFYFTHSYKMTSANNHCNGTCNYGEEFIVSFEKENIYGTQFHPEKSQNNGLILLKNFIEKL